MATKGFVSVRDRQLKRYVRLAEVEDKVPEDVPVLAQLIQIALLHAPIVDIDLQVNLNQISQLK